MSISVDSDRFDEVYDQIERGLTIPSEWYTDPEIFRIEQERIFRKAWQFVGHVDRLANPGDYFIHRVAGVSLIVTRDEHGDLHALENVCRHRGTELVEGTDPGNRRMFQCRFHGWTYGLDGCLRGVPRQDEGIGFDKADYPLYRGKVDTWGPFLFVTPDPDAPDLLDYLGELPGIARAAGLEIDRARPPVRRVWELNANWKLLMENFLECYHCQLNHPGFTKFVNTTDVSLAEYETFSLQLYNLKERPKEDDGAGFFDVEEGALFDAVVWPNFVFNVYPGPGNVTTQVMLPVDVDRSLMVYEYFLFDDVDEAEAEEFIEFWDQVQLEDKPLVEAVQRGLGSGSFRGGPVFGMERQITHFEKLVHRAVSGS